MRSTALACLGGLMLVSIVAYPEHGFAQTTGPAAAKPAKGKAAAPQAETAKPDPAAAERAMEAGIKAYEAGKNEQAAQTLSGAMQGGALPGPKMARALYYRGLAYRKLARPAQAISDLTSALWLKGGLTEAERTDALASREAAYMEAGIAEAPAVTTAAAKATTTPAKAASSTAPPPPSAPAAIATAAVVASPSPSTTEKPADKAPEGSSGPGGVSGFFSNLFSSGGSATSAPAAAGAPAGSASSPAPEPAASSWSSTTNSITGAKPTGAAPAAPGATAATAAAPVAKAAKVATATTAPAPAFAADGKFRLQVAAVRSRAEAEAIGARVKKEFAKKLAGREALVDEAVIGNMGTFYRVRVGPYANANEPRQLCIQLRASGGYDCMVVTQ